MEMTVSRAVTVHDQVSTTLNVSSSSTPIQLCATSEDATIDFNPRSTPTYLPEILTPITPLDATISSIATLITSTQKPPTLLSIPLEIRRQIYSYVLYDHPIRHAHLSPITTSSTSPTYVKEEFHHTVISPCGYMLNHGPGISYPSTPGNRATVIVPSSSNPRHKERSFSDSRKMEGTHQTLISSTEPILQTKLPAGLLASCSQIYEEARLMPFQENSFCFVNWFWSGVYAARQFSRGLCPWQSEAMRWAAIEVLGRDLTSGSMEVIGGSIGGLAGMALDSLKNSRKGGEWTDLCVLWKGVWGLRLGIKGKVASEKVGNEKGLEGNDDLPLAKIDPLSSVARDQKIQDDDVLNTAQPWVQNGLLRMKSLRFIEIEIDDADVTRDTKISFCVALGDILNEKRDRSDGWSGDVKVIFVERVTVEEEEEAFVWFGGQPPN